MSKFGPFARSSRETARLAWRSRVDAAAREWAEFAAHFRDKPSGPMQRWSGVCRMMHRALGCNGPSTDELGVLDAALSSPKPWRSKSGRSDR